MRWLVQQGFERVPSIEAPGEFAVHGGIIDIFPPDANDPLRVELFGDEIDSIRRFDVETQRKVEDLKQVALTAIRPKSEGTKRGTGLDEEDPCKAQDPALLRRPTSSTRSRRAAGWVLSELQDLVDEGKHYLERLENPQGTVLRPGNAGPDDRAADRDRLRPSRGDSAETTCRTHGVESIERFAGPRAEVLNELATIVGRDETVLIACHNQGERDRLGELLKESVPELAPGDALPGDRDPRVPARSRPNSRSQRQRAVQPASKSAARPGPANGPKGRAIDSFL